jgi:hypothetical protein
MFYRGGFRDKTRPLDSPDFIPIHTAVTIGTADFNGAEEHRDINKLDHLRYMHFKTNWYKNEKVQHRECHTSPLNTI